MTVRGGRGPRDPMADPAPQPAPAEYGYRRSARYGRGPGDQRRYERYGDHRGGFLGLVRFLLFLARVDHRSPLLTLVPFQLAKNMTPEHSLQPPLNNRLVDQ